MSRKIGLQLYTVREAAKRDFIGTLKHVAEMGYHGIEAAGNLGGLPVKELRAILSDLNLKIFSGHIPIDAINRNFDQLCADYAALGARYIGVPWLGEEYRNATGYVRAARSMEKAAMMCVKHGLTFFYHNHDFEFAPLNGRYAFDVLLDAADPYSVQIELDAGWSERAGVDTIGFMQKLNGRLPLVHIKDWDAELKDFVPIGEGMIDFGPIFDAGDAQGVDWYVVEQDRAPKGELESARASFKNIVERGWLR